MTVFRAFRTGTQLLSVGQYPLGPKKVNLAAQGQCSSHEIDEALAIECMDSDPHSSTFTWSPKTMWKYGSRPKLQSAEWTATPRLKQDLPYASSYISVSGWHLRSVVHSIVGRLCQAGCSGTSFPPFPPALNHPVEVSGQANGWARAWHGRWAPPNYKVVSSYILLVQKK